MIANDSNRKLQLGQLLIQHGAVTDDQLKSALEYQKQKGATMLLGEVLQKLDICSEEQIMSALAAGYGIPFAHISPRIADPKVIDVLPREFLDKHCVLPLFKIRNRLTLAVNEPANVFLIEEIGRLTDCEILIVCATTKEIKATLENHLPSANIFVIDDIFDDGDAGELSLVETKVEDIGDLELAAEGSPVIKLVNLIIDEAVRGRASDIHVEPMADRVRVRYRIDGVCIVRDNIPKSMQAAVTARLKIISGIDISEKRLPQDGRIKKKIGTQLIDFRVSSLPAYHGESIVLRILRPDSVRVGITGLGFEQDSYEKFQNIINAPNGIFLVTGPTGSGKTTTLYAALQELNRPDRKIITAEDPVEYNFTGMNQCQVKEEIGLTFGRILRAMLRQAPNIILVGEIRDREVGEVAVQAALTGHLVFSTLHTNDAPSAIARLIDMGIKPFLVASSIQAIMAQRLIRVICKECKEIDPAPDRFVLKVLDIKDEDLEGRHLYRGRGCPRCGNVGYRGRQGIFELLEMNNELRDLAFNRAPTTQLRKAARAAGMRNLLEDGKLKIMRGVTTPVEIARIAQAEGVVRDEE